MQRNGPCCPSIALAFAALLTGGRAGAADPLKVTVCELLTSPHTYSGATVQVFGQTEGRWFESSPFRDAHCGGKGKLNLEGEAAGLDRLRKASIAADNTADSATAGIKATLIGRFEYRPQTLNAFALVVNKVLDISPTPVPSAVPPPPAPSQVHSKPQAASNY